MLIGLAIFKVDGFFTDEALGTPLAFGDLGNGAKTSRKSRLKKDSRASRLLPWRFRSRRERRNWKAVLDYGQKVLDIASRATDLGLKLAPFTQAVIAHMENAGHFIK